MLGTVESQLPGGKGDHPAGRRGDAGAKCPGFQLRGSKKSGQRQAEGQVRMAPSGEVNKLGLQKIVFSTG